MAESNEGHRERLRDRFRRSGEAGFADHELLELLLTYSNPRRDVKPLARKLLDRFGNLRGLLGAPVADLRREDLVTDRTAVLLALVRPLVGRSERPETTRGRRSRADSPEKVREYFSLIIGGSAEEEVHLALLDSRNGIIQTQRLARGTVDQAVVFPRQVLEQGLLHKASGVLLVHNHPSGDPTPSTHDRKLTDALRDACRAVGLRLVDHVVLGEGLYYSFREAGELT